MSESPHPPAIALSEYAERRKALRKCLEGSVGVVLAGDFDGSLHAEFRPHPHFEYLTGIVDEPAAVLVLDPSSPVEARTEMLFLRPLDPEVEKWDGYRLEIGSAPREKTGLKAVFRSSSLARFLGDAARRSRSLACLHPLANHQQPVSPDLAMFQKLAERIPGTSIEDRSEEIAKLRSIKSRDEVAMIQRAVDITGTGLGAVMRSIRPGMGEFDVQEILEHTFRTNGSRGPAFGTIVGSGINSTVLHYKENRGAIEDGDLVCIDSGAAFGGYGADVTRTIPARGTFTERQKEIYEIVLKAMNAAIKAVKPGTTLAEIDKAARAIIVKAGYGDFFIHGIGHHLGLETHDVTPDGPLAEGAVITIEPGIYLPDEKLGVRIEDDLLVTETGSKNLSAGIPKTVAAIEKAMDR